MVTNSSTNFSAFILTFLLYGPFYRYTYTSSNILTLLAPFGSNYGVLKMESPRFPAPPSCGRTAFSIFPSPPGSFPKPGSLGLLRAPALHFLPWASCCLISFLALLRLRACLASLASSHSRAYRVRLKMSPTRRSVNKDAKSINASKTLSFLAATPCLPDLLLNVLVVSFPFLSCQDCLERPPSSPLCPS